MCRRFKCCFLLLLCCYTSQKHQENRTYIHAARTNVVRSFVHSEYRARERDGEKEEGKYFLVSHTLRVLVFVFVSFVRSLVRFDIFSCIHKTEAQSVSVCFCYQCRLPLPSRRQYTFCIVIATATATAAPTSAAQQCDRFTIIKPNPKFSIGRSIIARAVSLLI